MWVWVDIVEIFEVVVIKAWAKNLKLHRAKSEIFIFERVVVIKNKKCLAKNEILILKSKASILKKLDRSLENYLYLKNEGLILKSSTPDL